MMSALSESLVAAQRQAIAALSKAYVNGDTAGFFEKLNEMGCTDTVEQVHLMAALDTLRDFGAQAPQAEHAKPGTSRDMATDKQLKYAAKLADEQGTVLPDYPLTKDAASTIINHLQAGRYNPDEWTVPF